MIKAEMLIPTTTYGNLKLIGEVEDLPAMEKLQERYAERPLKWSSEVYKEITTFTGETVLYCEETHNYKSKDGKHLIGGSTYAKAWESPFDKQRIATAYAVKNNMAVEDVLAIWEVNGKLSRNFGSAIHLALENWFKYRDMPAYNRPKNAFLDNIIDTSPIRDLLVHSEIMVSNVAKGMVGQIDALVETTQEPGQQRSGYIVDFKSDNNVKKNLKKHNHQLSYYAQMLIDTGWNITHLEIHSFTDKWEVYTMEVLPIKE